MRIGPSFIKIGKAILYPVSELDRWDKFNLVMCRPSRSLSLEEYASAGEPDRHGRLFKSRVIRYDEHHDAESVIRRDFGVSFKILHDHGLFITASHPPHIPINAPVDFSVSAMC
jgi:hypothetical protein